jgi:hypothetical protein
VEQLVGELPQTPTYHSIGPNNAGIVSGNSAILALIAIRNTIDKHVETNPRRGYSTFLVNLTGLVLPVMQHPLRYLAALLIGAPAAISLLTILLTAAIRSKRLPLCPRCGRSKVRPSQIANSIDQALRVLMLSPSRCQGCLTRFYTFHRRAM